MRNDEEIEQAQNAGKLRASMGSFTPPTTAQSRALVFEDENGKPVVKRRWLMGDPWTTDYYFADWKTDSA